MPLVLKVKEASYEGKTYEVLKVDLLVNGVSTEIILKTKSPFERNLLISEIKKELSK